MFYITFLKVPTLISIQIKNNEHNPPLKYPAIFFMTKHILFILDLVLQPLSRNRLIILFGVLKSKSFDQDGVYQYNELKTIVPTFTHVIYFMQSSQSCFMLVNVTLEIDIIYYNL